MFLDEVFNNFCLHPTFTSFFNLTLAFLEPVLTSLFLTDKKIKVETKPSFPLVAQPQPDKPESKESLRKPLYPTLFFKKNIPNSSFRWLTDIKSLALLLRAAEGLLEIPQLIKIHLKSDRKKPTRIYTLSSLKQRSPKLRQRFHFEFESALIVLWKVNIIGAYPHRRGSQLPGWKGDENSKEEFEMGHPN